MYIHEYQIISLPIPTTNKKYINIIVSFYNPLKKPIRFSLQFPDNTVIKNIINTISKYVKIPSIFLIPTHIYKNTIYQIIPLNKKITNMKTSDIIILYESPNLINLKEKS